MTDVQGIGAAQVAEDAKKSMLRKLIIAATVFTILACGAMLGVGVLAANTAKEVRPDASGRLLTIDGKLVQMDVDSITYNASEVAELSTQALRKAREMLAVQADNTVSLFLVSVCFSPFPGKRPRTPNIRPPRTD